jgi:hypothetical protein
LVAKGEVESRWKVGRGGRMTEMRVGEWEEEWMKI